MKAKRLCVQCGSPFEHPCAWAKCCSDTCAGARRRSFFGPRSELTRPQRAAVTRSAVRTDLLKRGMTVYEQLVPARGPDFVVASGGRYFGVEAVLGQVGANGTTYHPKRHESSDVLAIYLPREGAVEYDPPLEEGTLSG